MYGDVRHLHNIAHYVAHVHVDVEPLEVYGKQHQCLPCRGAGLGLRRARTARAGPSLVVVCTYGSINKFSSYNFILDIFNDSSSIKINF